MVEYASAIAGLVSLSLDFARTIYRYSSSVKHAPKSVAKLQAEANAIQGVLSQLDLFLREHRNELDPTSALFLATNGCAAWLADFKKRLPPLSKVKYIYHIFHRLKWPLDEQDTHQAAECLHRFVQTFHFALDIQGFEILSKAQADAISQIENLIQKRAVIQSNQLNAISLQLEDVINLLNLLPDMLMELEDIKHKLDVLEATMEILVIDEEFSKFLNWIPTLNYQEKHQDVQRRRLKNSAKWFFRLPEFKSWVNGSTSEATLWCPGAPGAGKTFLTSIIIDTLLYRVRFTKGRLAYFYFYYGEQDQQKPEKVLCCLLRQILSAHQRLPKTATELHCIFQLGLGIPAWEKLVKAFGKVCAGNTETFIVIDALDECNPESHRQSIFEVLRTLSQSGAKICVTSREFAEDINFEFSGCTKIRIAASEEDVRRLLQLKITTARHMRRLIDKELKEEIVQTVVTKSRGMFLLPALQIDYILEQTTTKQVRKALNDLPIKLTENFDLTIKRITHQGSSRASLAMKTLLWLSHVRRPLKLLELQHAIGTSPGAHHLTDVELADPEFFVAYSLGLVVYDRETFNIRFVHQSVNEYIHQQRDSLFPDAEKTLAITCLTYLLLDDLYSPVQSEYSINLKPVFAPYAANHWGDHARQSFDEDVEKLSLSLLGNESAVTLWGQLTGSGTGQPETRPIHIAALLGLKTLVVRFLEHEGDLNTQNPQKETPLMLAAKSGHEEVVSLLLSKDSLSKNAQAKNGKTALCYAVEENRDAIVRLLIQHDDLDVNLGRPIEDAIERDEIAEMLLTRPDLDINSKYSPDGKTPLWDAVSSVKRDVVRMILDRRDLDPVPQGKMYGIDGHPIIGALSLWIEYFDIMTPGEMMNSLLILEMLVEDERVSAPNNARCVYTWRVFAEALEDENGILMKSLREHGIDAFFTDAQGQTFLHQAVTDVIKADELIRKLLDLGLDPNKADHSGWTALHEAAEYGKESAARILLENGACATASSMKATSVLHQAVKSGHNSIVRLLLDHGADACAKDLDGTCVLDAACYSGKCDTLVPLLLENGANPDTTDFADRSCLHTAAQHGTAAVCLMLLDKGAKLNKLSFFGYGFTPVSIAMRCRKADVVQALISRGADPTILDLFGRSSWDWASKDPLLLQAMEHWVEEYVPTPFKAQQKHLLACLQFRISFMLNCQPEQQTYFLLNIGYQLLYLGDEREARIIFRSKIRKLFANLENDYEFFTGCRQCQSKSIPIFICKSCPDMLFCSKCIKDNPKSAIPWCSNHQFLEIPGEGWTRNPEGIVDEEGRTVQERLKFLQMKYGEPEAGTP